MLRSSVGGTALDVAIAQGLGDNAEARGLLVLTLSVVAIVMTAPVGALSIAILGPRWLRPGAGAPPSKSDPEAETALQVTEISTSRGMTEPSGASEL